MIKIYVPRIWFFMIINKTADLTQRILAMHLILTLINMFHCHHPRKYSFSFLKEQEQLRHG